jgi:2'-5' RNA ligase
VLWLGITLRPEIEALQAACEAAAVAAGFSPETRSFRAHLTLGRWRERARRPALPQVDLGVSRLDRLVLFKSDLKPSGAVHTALSTFALGA